MNAFAFSADDRIGDFLARYPQLAVPLAALGAARHEERTVSELAAGTGREPATLLDAFAVVARRRPAADDEDWSAAPLGELVAHLIDVHHAFTREELLRLERIARQLPESAAPLRADLAAVTDDLLAHLAFEEAHLLPACAALDDALARRTLPSRSLLAQAAREVERGHRTVESTLPALAAAARALLLPPGKEPLRAALVDGLDALADDLVHHQHEEADCLLPAALHARDVLSITLARRSRRDDPGRPR